MSIRWQDYSVISLGTDVGGAGFQYDITRFVGPCFKMRVHGNQTSATIVENFASLAGAKARSRSFRIQQEAA
jgi:hypothetical protein